VEIKVCIGSACYVKGSHDVIEQLGVLIQKYKRNDIELKASFCLGQCTSAVSVEVDGTIYSVNKCGVEEFFKNHILGQA
jgi:NADH:ubiquinone oxidoreductase subunit E